MPYYRQHGQVILSYPRARPTPSASTGHHSGNAGATAASTAVHMSAGKFASSILCRLTFSLFLFAIALFLFQLSINNVSNKKEGSNIIAAILLTIAIVSFLRTCQTLRRYLTIMHTRRRLIQVERFALRIHLISFFLIQRLRERQQALASNSDSASPEYVIAFLIEGERYPHVFCHSSLIMGDIMDLPTYKELFPSHGNISGTGTDPSSTLPPPSYDDFVKTLFVRQPPTTLPLSTSRPHALSLPTSSLSTSAPSQTSPSRCIWITDRTRRPVCIRGTVTYV